MTLKVPFNTKARIVVTPKELETLKINNTAFSAYQKANEVSVIDNTYVLLGSGAYTIEYKKAE
jgi:alpha-L-rhamnosidase